MSINSSKSFLMQPSSAVSSDTTMNAVASTEVIAAILSQMSGVSADNSLSSASMSLNHNGMESGTFGGAKKKHYNGNNTNTTMNSNASRWQNRSNQVCAAFSPHSAYRSKKAWFPLNGNSTKNRNYNFSPPVSISNASSGAGFRKVIPYYTENYPIDQRNTGYAWNNTFFLEDASLSSMYNAPGFTTHTWMCNSEVSSIGWISNESKKLLIRQRLIEILLKRGNAWLSFRSVGNDETIKGLCKKLKLMYVIQEYSEDFKIKKEEVNRYFVCLTEKHWNPRQFNSMYLSLHNCISNSALAYNNVNNGNFFQNRNESNCKSQEFNKADKALSIQGFINYYTDLCSALRGSNSAAFNQMIYRLVGESNTAKSSSEINNQDNVEESINMCKRLLIAAAQKHMLSDGKTDNNIASEEENKNSEADIFSSVYCSIVKQLKSKNAISMDNYRCIDANMSSSLYNTQTLAEDRNLSYVEGFLHEKGEMINKNSNGEFYTNNKGKDTEDYCLFSHNTTSKGAATHLNENYDSYDYMHSMGFLNEYDSSAAINATDELSCNKNKENKDKVEEKVNNWQFGPALDKMSGIIDTCVPFEATKAASELNIATDFSKNETVANSSATFPLSSQNDSIMYPYPESRSCVDGGGNIVSGDGNDDGRGVKMAAALHTAEFLHPDSLSSSEQFLFLNAAAKNARSQSAAIKNGDNDEKKHFLHDDYYRDTSTIIEAMRLNECNNNYVNDKIEKVCLKCTDGASSAVSHSDCTSNLQTTVNALFPHQHSAVETSESFYSSFFTSFSIMPFASSAECYQQPSSINCKNMTSETALSCISKQSISSNSLSFF